MKFALYTNSKDAWAAMYNSMALAQKSIFLEMFIFSHDTSDEYDFVRLLTEKARLGVRVVLILDSFGSRDFSTEAINKIHAAGGEIVFFRKGLFGTHRKVLIVDSREAFVGGVNIKNAARSWHDLMISLTEKHSVYLLGRMFARTYKALGGTEELVPKKKQRRRFKKIGAYIIEHAPFFRAYALDRQYRQIFFQAKQNLCLVTPYFVPAVWMFHCVRTLIARGASVDILIPRATDNFLLDRANSFYAKKMFDIGVSIYWFDAMNHAKLVLVDEKIVSIGSGNINNNSFHFSNEAHIVSHDQALITQTAAVVEKWKMHSKKAQQEDFVFFWYDYVCVPIIRLFSFVL